MQNIEKLDSILLSKNTIIKVHNILKIIPPTIDLAY